MNLMRRIVFLVAIVNCEVEYIKVRDHIRLDEKNIVFSKSATSLEDCIDVCTRERNFDCVMFEYRFDTRSCYFADKSLDDLPTNGYYTSVNSEIYGRSSSYYSNRRACYGLLLDYHRHYTYRIHISVPTRERCFQECRDTNYCQTFSFRLNSDYENCLLSDSLCGSADCHNIEQFEDRNWAVYALEDCRGGEIGRENQGNGGRSCFTLYGRHRLRRSYTYQDFITNNRRDCEDRCSDDFKCRSFSVSSTSNGELFCSLSESIDNDRAYERDADSDVFYSCSGGGGRGNGGRFNLEFSVNGEQCDTNGCRENQDVGYWYCNIEESQDWDYCCRPEERCQRSMDHTFPWCYVGNAGSDQWRPCKL